MTRYASRKFLLALAALLLTAGLCYAGKIDGGVYMSVAIAAIGIYSSANVVQKATAKDGP